MTYAAAPTTYAAAPATLAMTGCTALSYAVECAKGQGALPCMKRLIVVRADVNHVAGVNAKNCRQRHIGTQLPLGLAAAQAGDMKKFNLLLERGHDINLGSETGRLPVHALCEASDASPEMLEKYVELRKRYVGKCSRRFDVVADWLWSASVFAFLPPCLDNVDMQVLFFGAPNAQAVTTMLNSITDLHRTVEVPMPSFLYEVNSFHFGLFDVLYLKNPRHMMGDLSSLNALLERKWTLYPEVRKGRESRVDFLMCWTVTAVPVCMEWMLDQKVDPTSKTMYRGFKVQLDFMKLLFPNQIDIYTDWLLKQELQKASETDPLNDRASDAIGV